MRSLTSILFELKKNDYFQQFSPQYKQIQFSRNCEMMIYYKLKRKKTLKHEINRKTSKKKIKY